MKAVHPTLKGTVTQYSVVTLKSQPLFPKNPATTATTAASGRTWIAEQLGRKFIIVVSLGTSSGHFCHLSSKISGTAWGCGRVGSVLAEHAGSSGFSPRVNPTLKATLCSTGQFKASLSS